MKKKIVSFAAVLMAMAMTTTSAFAVTPRESGDVDASGTVTAGDAVMILDSAIKGVNIEKGDFDGVWKSVDKTVTKADADLLLSYVLQPENNFEESVSLRVYSTQGKGEGKVVNILNGLELDSDKNYDNSYTDTTKDISVADNSTLLSVLEQAKNLAVNSQKDIDTLSDNINKVYFTSAEKGDVYLTSKEGWAKLAYALKAINPVSPETCELIGKDKDSNYDNMDDATSARVAAFEQMGNIITRSGAGQLSLTAKDVEDLYALALKAFPGNGEIEAEKYALAADDTYAIYSEKYAVSAETEQQGIFDLGRSTDPYFSEIVDFLRNYETKTIQDVRNVFGDKISVSNGSNTVVAELYAAGTLK